MFFVFQILTLIFLVGKRLHNVPTKFCSSYRGISNDGF